MLVVLGALLLAGSVFLRWLHVTVDLKDFRSVSATGWQATRVSRPLFTCAAAAVMAVVAWTRWRYPLALLAGAGAGGLAYAWKNNASVGPWIGMLAAALVVIGAFVGFAVSPMTASSSLTRRGRKLAIAGVLALLVAGYVGPFAAATSQSCSSRSSVGQEDTVTVCTVQHTNGTATSVAVVFAILGGVLFLVGLVNREPAAHRDDAGIDPIA